MRAVGTLLTSAARAVGDRPALVTGERELTYRDLDQEANRAARALESLGIGRGDRVATVLCNTADQVIAWHATQKIGAVFVPLNVRLHSDELSSLLEASETRLVLTCPSHRELARTAAATRGVQVAVCRGAAEGPEVDWHSLVAAQEASDATRPGIGGGDGSMILFTSGTTGRPKGVLRSHDMVLDYALMMAAENGWSAGPETLVTHCPLYHTAGMALLMKMVAIRGTLVLMHRFDPSTALDLIEEHAATQVLLLPPVLYQRVLDAQRARPRDLDSVREAQSSGGRSTIATVASIHELFPGAAVRYSWGSTETCAPTATVVTPEQVAATPQLATTVGTPNVMVEIRLVDEAGLDVPDGAAGEAWVRSPMVCHGYLGEAPGENESFVGEWFRTGDLMYRDDDGFFYMVDRLKDMIKSGGENVYALELERLIAEIPGIADCAVIGLPDPCWGEAVAVAVVPDGTVDVTAEHVVEHCRLRTASFRRPRYFALVDDLPRSSTGKVDKSDLKRRGRALFAPIS